ncbi:uncharacterized protein LOC142101645 [Mixophyes fleayi]|uniref:uncharacterized protein LOC142101645 n=1 Tax=Mixophyes fleayi TaxID=3061075 RepID=UPI003F4DEF5F
MSHKNKKISSTPKHTIIKALEKAGGRPKAVTEAADTGSDSEDNSSPENLLTPKDVIAIVTKTIQSELRSIVSELRSEISELGSRTDVVENQLDVVSKHQQTTDTEIADLRAEFSTFKDQLEDLENRNRRNNIWIKNVPESISAEALPDYLEGLFLQMLPDLSKESLNLDRAHRALRPKPNPDQPPRDIIIRFHFFKTKERIMASARNAQSISYSGSHLQLYQDLAQSTLKKRRDLINVTKVLRNHSIKYKWGFPFQLIVSKDGRSHSVRTPEQGLDLLRRLHLIQDSDPSTSASPSQQKTSAPTPSWQKM